MLTYVRKIIRFFIFLYALFMPSAIINAVAENNIQNNQLNAQLAKSDKTSEPDIPPIIGNNVHMVNSLLSTPSSELIEQAKSYALGKVNNTISSEAQKWLSQSSTAKINFGFDRKGRLENNSVDLLLPIYDNQANWFFFSQLGYRNKDSRNTVNLGLGGRYFSQDWMYGLNTFYDYDITGKNRRVGLGGELWGDYIKFSTNGYYRLSDWQISRDFEEHHERPANGYDINGEFFLSAYPNLGGKFSYEQYFGDNVTLFNRKTKQKNPSLATMGVTYTPIPLITMGVDYKQGERGQSETQFLTNFNFRLGVPLSAQLSPDNVASMRTLAGSRYDLVERNNNIVLDHKKIETIELIALPPIIGYGHQEIAISAPLRSFKNINNISWKVVDKEFEKYNGKLSAKSGKNITVTLPSYQDTHKQDYTLDIAITDNQGITKNTQVPVRILPFLIKGTVNITPPKHPEATGKEENGYTFDAPVITYQDSLDGAFVKNGKIDNVSWTTEPALGEESKLKFRWNNKSAQTNEKGELTDSSGKLLTNVLVSKIPKDNVDIYIQLDGAPRQKVGSVKFSDYKNDYKIENNQLNVTPDPQKALIADGKNKYKYTAKIITDNNLPVDTVNNVKWSAVGKNAKGHEVKDIFVDGPTGTVKTNKGVLEATLSSLIPLNDVVVTLSIENNQSVSAKAVSFIAGTKGYHVEKILIDKPSPLIVNDTYTYTAYIVDQDGKPAPEGQEISNVRWSINNNMSGITFTHKDGKDTTGLGGTLTASLKSTVSVNAVVVSLAVEDQITPIHATAVSFNDDPKFNYVKNITVSPPEACSSTGSCTLSADGEETYTYTAYIVDQDGKPAPEGQKISNVKWSKNNNTQGLIFTHEDGKDTTGSGGTLTATLKSTAIADNVAIFLAVEEQKSPVKAKDEVSFIAPYILTLDVEPKTPPKSEGKANKYTFTATVKRVKNNKPQQEQDVPIIWSAILDKTSLPVKDPHLFTEQSDKTNPQGQAKFTMYSDKGGFDNIIVTALMDKNYLFEPNDKNKPITVSILTIPKNEEDILLFPYNFNGHKSAQSGKIKKQRISTRDLNFGWNKLKFLTVVRNNTDVQGSTPYFYPDDNNKIVAHQATANKEAYLEVTETDRINAKLQSRWNFPSGRYLLYQTTINMDFMVFPDPGGNGGRTVGAQRITPVTHCTEFQDVKDTDMSQGIRDSMLSKKVDLKFAGLLGSNSNFSVYNYIGLDGANSTYTQTYPIAPVSENVENVYIMLCKK
ncbi:inverse autotransporter beta domain-containing protein [Xenorhabdus sp. PB61.4]|uniref:inverse autotransporter beta domain-containing protein n=1 Tax=Xenorhabdus sp. PB61.4 TaxID=2788940 RepID=UPI001E411DED|nr:inverse autotransporter beta domain-containing protein [Xenorhabdus sp. PB61.4]MCC8365219.1 inverse autotransporter beta domain-containing protein [Xenorhabdus sp. PB61.4]